MKVYIAEICFNCRNWLYLADLRGITLETVNIMENTANLKEFLRLRDGSSAFDPIRERGAIGIPCFVDGDFITFSPDEALARLGQPPVKPEEIREHSAG